MVAWQGGMKVVAFVETLPDRLHPSPAGDLLEHSWCFRERKRTRRLLREVGIHCRYLDPAAWRCFQNGIGHGSVKESSHMSSMQEVSDQS